MAENTNKISQIQVGNTTYDICDAIARDKLNNIQDKNDFVLFNEDSNTGITNTFFNFSSGITPSLIRFARWNCLGMFFIILKISQPTTANQTVTIATGTDIVVPIFEINVSTGKTTDRAYLHGGTEYTDSTTPLIPNLNWQTPEPMTSTSSNYYFRASAYILQNPTAPIPL